MKIQREYTGGYCKTTDADAILAAKKVGLLSKVELRLFFAQLEHEETKKTVPIDIILNGKTPKRRVTSGEQERGLERLNLALTDLKEETELTTKVPRKFVRAAALGQLTVSQMIAGLFYFRWRKPQRKKMDLVWKGERYASFTYQMAKEITGLARATLCEAFKFLRKQKIIAVAWRPMEQIKKWGMLFVDGEKLNLYCRKDERYRGSNPWVRLQKKRTDSAKNTNAINKTLPKNSFSFSNIKKAVREDAIDKFRQRFCPQMA